MSTVSILRKQEVNLDLLDENGVMLLKPASFYDALPPDHMRLWCHANARYGLPTTELIGWLRQRIGCKSCIEIGGAHGDFGTHLGVPSTDNKMQEWPKVRLHYMAINQPTIKYAKFVEEIEAGCAVAKYRPDVVFASWVTQHATEESGERGSSWGVHEEDILDMGVTYILLGNLGTHAWKRILQRPHEEHALPFLRSRAADPTLDRVWIWNG